MIKKTWWKWLILVAALLVSGIALIGIQKDAQNKTRFVSKLRYGVDISGGCTFTLEIDKNRLREMIQEDNPNYSPKDVEDKVKETVDNSGDIAAEIIRKRIDPLGTKEPVITRGKKDGRLYVTIAGADEKTQQEAARSLKDVAFLEFRLVYAQNERYTADLFSKNQCPPGYRIVDIEGRKYYLRDESYASVSEEPGYETRLSRFAVPDGSRSYQFMLERRGGTDENPRFSPVFVRRSPELTGEMLRRADVEIDSLGKYQITLAFNDKGRDRFADVTEKNVGNQLAIVLDGTVYSAPVIQTAILNGNAQITGNFSQEEAIFLKNILNAGALPAPLKIVSQSSVSPTVGADALRGAKSAMLWGIGAILVFMLVYYGVCGIVADVAFLLNIALLACATVIVQGVFGVLDSEISTAGSKMLQLPILTLPGIAGLLLTFGMAVDANVLTFERTREELAAGKGRFAAIMAGYDRAFLAILDSNVTTVITAAILFAFGSGPVRNFAIMLTAGILVSMFTALVVTRLIFLATVREGSTGGIKMLQLIPASLKVDFIGVWRKYAVVAAVVAVAGIGLGIVRGHKSPGTVFAVDFTGGSKITYRITNPETVRGKEDSSLAAIRKTFADAGVADARPQFQAEGEGLQLTVDTVSPLEKINSDEISKKLTENVPETVFEWIGNDEVGAQIGDEFKKAAAKAVVFALIGMILYITVRFEFGFALGALAALVHDVLVTLGVYLLMGRQISLVTVAAVLTIVGYSVNDTIVIFDRVREELRNPKSKGLSLRELCNTCINTTLSRTVLTSLTTAFTVIALLVFSTGEIRDFAVVMLCGVILGTLSTIFIANPVMLLWYKGRRPDFSARTR